MDSDEAWQKAKSLQGVKFRRWTSSGATGQQFEIQIVTSRTGESIHFFREDIDVKSASRARFAEFFDMWTSGVRDPEAFRNAGEQGTKAEVIHFLIPVFEAVLRNAGHRAAGISRVSKSTPTDRHFVQYHVVSPGNPLPSDFRVRTARPGLVATGDVVWLLAGARTGRETRYSFVYWFRVSSIQSQAGETILVGTEGGRIDPPWAVGFDQPWFADLFKRQMGNGAFGFQVVPEQLVDVFSTRLTALRSLAARDAENDLSEGLGPEDERQHRAILTRRGQAGFRAKLLDAYGSRCAVSESRVVGLLEAAHIIPHSEASDYRLSNGLLLRSDIHTLFDLHLLGIDDRLRVHLSEEIRSSEYARFHGKQIERLPPRISDSPSAAALSTRFEVFRSKEHARAHALSKFDA